MRFSRRGGLGLALNNATQQRFLTDGSQAPYARSPSVGRPSSPVILVFRPIERCSAAGQPAAR
jgi:hypothetical protein